VEAGCQPVNFEKDAIKFARVEHAFHGGKELLGVANRP
jgi:hypothetical protein